MRSFVCRGFGDLDAIAIEEHPDPVPGAGEVLVRMTAANVAFVDRLIVRGEYQVRPPLPFTPGVVAAGEVLSTGPGVEHLQPGTSVVLLKSSYGAWSTHVVVPAWAVVPTPANVPDEIAAAAIEAYGTASYALEERGGLAPGETVLILGAGGAVGAAAVEIALHLDAEVIAHTSDTTIWDDHRVRPQHIIDRKEHPDIRAYMREHFPRGVDLAMDPVSGDQANGVLRSLAPNGRMLVVGFAGGSIASLASNFILLSNRAVIGVEWATWITTNTQHLARTLDVVLNRLSRGAFHPPKPTMVSLDELPEVLAEGVPASGLVRTIVTP
ncbi:zinc-binding dehydrogenase [Gordonia amarae]|uniref:Zinc-binding dehydrogenase n=2 Tax=Gordonia amarae TaxID=36821 RepID=A0A857KIE8_9ACTN|nr:zinc-binding dehydrogenase [Gordonia amarae]MCS3878220.1 NADPH2:quinone reductase [Gordonia amarae]QHN16885.1 zinc-binding dehydrogenase [Gordonia amarae]QHN21410.1 zinc-binding dehydrogenase [Gordonia amarae]QHN30261.1 zinc-binding dehydrogenase [Gordonia amarae]QHN39037.1 zinc-binding dehydrogenase [Gordonia amarae]